MRSFIASLIILFVAASSIAADLPAPMTKGEFDARMQDISNWGRWGDDDELGTLNLITPAKRVAAAVFGKDGINVDLALDLNKLKDELKANPFEQE